MKTALLIVDMENDCFKEGGYNHGLVKDGLIPIDLELYASPIPYIQKLSAAFRAAELPVVYVSMVLKADYSDACWPYWRHIDPVGRKFHVEGTWGSEIVDELKPQEGDHLVHKKGYGGFHGTGLEILLRNLGVEKCVVTGVGTPICVGTTVREGAARNFRMVVVSDATASFTKQTHEAELDMIGRPIADVKTTDEVIESLK